MKRHDDGDDEGMEKVKIILTSNGYKYEGPILRENTEYIVIRDDYTNAEMSFPKTAVIITRTGGHQQ